MRTTIVWSTFLDGICPTIYIFHLGSSAIRKSTTAILQWMGLHACLFARARPEAPSMDNRVSANGMKGL